MCVVDDYLKKEEIRQKQKIILNAALSECPRNVKKMLSSAFVNIDAEGYAPQWMLNKTVEELCDCEKIQREYEEKRDKRSNKCCENFNAIEVLTIKYLKQVFANERISENDIFVNVQSPTGAIANLIAINSFVEFDDTIVSMELSSGGHLSHGSELHFVGKRYRCLHYGVNECGDIDYDKIEKLLKENEVGLLIAGASSYPRQIDWARLRAIVNQVSPKTKFMADIAHTAGLVAGEVFPSPFGYADVVTMVGYKTFCGPRSAPIFSFTKEDSIKINRTCFPGFIGSPLTNQIAALCVSAQNALKPAFKKLMENVIRNARLFEKVLNECGFITAFQGTQSHIVLLDLKASALNLTGEQAANLLEDNGIMVNKNVLPGNHSNAEAEGIRFGFTWTAQKRYSEKRIIKLAQTIAKILKPYRL